MLSPVIIVAIVVVVIILLYFMSHSSSAASTTGASGAPSTSAVGKIIDLSSATLINPYPDANGVKFNANQAYTYSGNGIFTGVTSPTLFLYVFQPAGSSNLYALADNKNTYITNPPATAGTPNSWAGAGIVDITKFASSYTDITPLTLSANTITMMPASYSNFQKF